MEKSGYWYCFWDKFQGWGLDYNSGRRYCFLRQINDYYDTEDVEDIKYKSAELMKFAPDFYSDLRKCAEIDWILYEMF